MKEKTGSVPASQADPGSGKIKGLNMTEAQVLAAVKNPFGKSMALDLIMVAVGTFAIPLLLMFAFAIIKAFVSVFTGIDVGDDWIDTAMLCALIACPILFLIKFFVDAAKRDRFDRVKAKMSDADVQRSLTQQALAERQASGQPLSAFDELTDRVYNGDMDLAMQDIVARAKIKDYSRVGGTGDALEALVASMSETQHKKYCLYGLSALAEDKAWMKKAVTEAADLAFIGMTDEEVRAADANPFGKKLLRGALLFVGGLVLVGVGIVISARQPQYDSLGKALTVVGPVLGSVAIVDLSAEIIKAFKFKKLKKQYLKEDEKTAG